MTPRKVRSQVAIETKPKRRRKPKQSPETVSENLLADPDISETLQPPDSQQPAPRLGPGNKYLCPVCLGFPDRVMENGCTFCDKTGRWGWV